MNTYATGIETGDPEQSRALCQGYADRLHALGAQNIELTPAAQVASNAWVVTCHFRANEQILAAYAAQA